MKANKYGVTDRKEYRRLWMQDFRRNNPERVKQYEESRKERIREREKELMKLWLEGKLSWYPGRVRS